MKSLELSDADHKKDKPFCFRCGGEPKYQLELTMRNSQGEIKQGPFWPLCYKCFLEIPWTGTLRNTVKAMEKRDND